jgi:hypothetical protein
MCVITGAPCTKMYIRSQRTYDSTEAHLNRRHSLRVVGTCQRVGGRPVSFHGLSLARVVHALSRFLA